MIIIKLITLQYTVIYPIKYVIKKIINYNSCFKLITYGIMKVTSERPAV